MHTPHLGRKLLFSFVSVLLFFGVLEVGLRVTGLSRQGAEVFFDNLFDPFAAMVPGAANPYSDIKDFVNKHGLRGEDFTQAKPAGIFRIICLGDSTTFGMAELPGTYPYLLEKELNRGFDTPRFEVINAGVPGTNIYQQRMLFQRVLKNTDPDMVIVMSGPNAREDLKAFRDALKSSCGSKLQDVTLLLAQSAVYRTMRRVIKGGVQESTRDDYEILFERRKELTADGDNQWRDRFLQDELIADYKEDLTIINRIADNWGFTLVFLGSFELDNIERMIKAGVRPDSPGLIETSLDHGIDPTVPRFVKDNGLTYIDLTGDFIGLDQTTPGLWHDPAHCGPLGNLIIAKRVASVLRQKKLVPLPH